MQLIAFVALIATATGVYARSGSGTFYTPGLGACGRNNSPSDFIVAVSPNVYNSFGNPNPGNPNTSLVCGKTIVAHHNGNSVTVTVVDRCVGCADGDLDFSPAAFQQLAPLSEGRIAITWDFV